MLFTLPNSIPACNRALHLQQSPLPTGSLEFVNVLVFGQVMGQWYTDPTSTMLNLRIPRGICSCRSLTKLCFEQKSQQEQTSEQRSSSAYSVSTAVSLNSNNVPQPRGMLFVDKPFWPMSYPLAYQNKALVFFGMVGQKRAR